MRALAISVDSPSEPVTPMSLGLANQDLEIEGWTPDGLAVLVRFQSTTGGGYRRYRVSADGLIQTRGFGPDRVAIRGGPTRHRPGTP